MYKLKIQDHFSAAHFLRNYQGPCEKLHGHNWKVELVVEGEKLDQTDILIDFKILKSILKSILQELDHQLLNDLSYFKEVNPSSEKIAELIFKKAREKLASYPDVKIKEVAIYESEKACAIYFEP